MLIHNKRLHPRRPCEPGEHYHGCMLHDMQEEPASPRRSKSPTSRSRSQTPSSSSLHSSSTALYDRRTRPKSTSSSNSILHSPRTPTNAAAPTLSWCTSTYNKRNSLGAFPTPAEHQIHSLFYDVVDAPAKPSLKPSIVNHSNAAKQKSKSTICLNSSMAAAGDAGKSEKRSNTVTFKCYDSPDEIIANLFPGIGDATDTKAEPKYLRKGHGAAQMSKTRSVHKDWSLVGRSSSATGNYAAPSTTTITATPNTNATSERKSATRSLSTHSDNSCRKTYVNGRLYSVERDFDNMGCVNFVCFFVRYALIAVLISNECESVNMSALCILCMHACIPVSLCVCEFA